MYPNVSAQSKFNGKLNLKFVQNKVSRVILWRRNDSHWRTRVENK